MSRIVIIGVIAGCLYLFTFTYLFFESIISKEFEIRKRYESIIPGLPILCINDVRTYSIVCLIMSILSVSMIFGIITKRASLSWPWILASFHVLGNYGYHILNIFLEWISKSMTERWIQENRIPILIFTLQLCLYFTIFAIFIGNLHNRGIVNINRF